MRNRHLFLLLTVLLAALLAVGCGTRQLTKDENDQFGAIAAKIAKAEQMDAKECAPKELAIAKAELDGARHEASESWEEAQGYIGRAEKGDCRQADIYTKQSQEYSTMALKVAGGGAK